MARLRSATVTTSTHTETDTDMSSVKAVRSSRITARSRKKNRPNAMGDNPLDGSQLFLDALLGGGGPGETHSPAPMNEMLQGEERVKSSQIAAALPIAPVRRAKKPEHYKVVSISLYKQDIARLEEMVTELKRRGNYRANKSFVIRQALAQLDLDRVSSTL